ncbi:hypothetical protein R3P38DRAFT_2821118 [Favolaschia claudopus]|uniref:Uncharacterized protein n=1 Tax=Favolaschia claudopus TaxID=2862362 RepID=A0AAW0EHR6_9AGAR
MDSTGITKATLLKDPKSSYLGMVDAPDKLGWRPLEAGQGEMVVEKTAVFAYDEKWEALSQETGGERETRELHKIEAAKLSFVAKISAKNCFLTPCGNWKGEAAYLPTLADVKLACELVAPHDTPFADDFPMVIRNLESLTSMAANENHTPKGILDWNSQSKRTIKVRHRLFEEKGDGDVDDSDLKQWPVKSPEAKEALRKMEKTHIVQKLAAYDIYKRRIPPSEYMRALRGAVVRVVISLHHWKIDKRAEDVYTADIVSLSVIRAATPSVIQGSPSKKGSPAKKRRVPSVDPWLDDDAEVTSPKKARSG